MPVLVTRTEICLEISKILFKLFTQDLAPTNQCIIIIIFRYLRSKFLRNGQPGFVSSKSPPLSFKMSLRKKPLVCCTKIENSMSYLIILMSMTFSLFLSFAFLYNDFDSTVSLLKYFTRACDRPQVCSNADWLAREERAWVSVARVANTLLSAQW